ncbi:MAG: hypothetical protein FWC01_04580 [Treponema sp.]|nr:hypothetical protein [Treponema sp.]MCL2237734.1 hypothetical protein [Treponema sp.]
MRKALVCLLILLAVPALIFAQDDSSPDVETDWDDFTTDPYVRGDQSVTISLGVSFPTVFIIHEGRHHNIEPPIGGTGSLVYTYYFGPHFFVGAEAGLLFLPTLRKDTIFIIPLGARVGTQFILGRFEFPIFASVGMVWHRLLNEGYYGMYARGGLSAFFKATSEWSFGFTSAWSWFPQWPDDPRQHVYANFVDVTVSARYHF